jgi:hypothetical protein
MDGIFEYKTQAAKVFNNQNKETDSVHAFNKKWSVYLTKGIMVYETDALLILQETLNG